MPNTKKSAATRAVALADFLGDVAASAAGNLDWAMDDPATRGADGRPLDDASGVAVVGGSGKVQRRLWDLAVGDGAGAQFRAEATEDDAGPPHVAYVGGLPKAASAETVRALFAKTVAASVTVTNVHVAGNRANEAGEFALAFVEVATAADLRHLVRLGRAEIAVGRYVTLDAATETQRAGYIRRTATAQRRQGLLNALQLGGAATSAAQPLNAASLHLLSVAGLPPDATKRDVEATLAAHTALGDAAAVRAAVLTMSVVRARDGGYALAYVAFRTAAALATATADARPAGAAGGRRLDLRVATAQQREDFARRHNERLGGAAATAGCAAPGRDGFGAAAAKNATAATLGLAVLRAAPLPSVASTASLAASDCLDSLASTPRGDWRADWRGGGGGSSGGVAAGLSKRAQRRARNGATAADGAAGERAAADAYDAARPRWLDGTPAVLVAAADVTEPLDWVAATFGDAELQRRLEAAWAGERGAGRRAYWESPLLPTHVPEFPASGRWADALTPPASPAAADRDEADAVDAHAAAGAAAPVAAAAEPAAEAPVAPADAGADTMCEPEATIVAAPLTRTQRRRKERLRLAALRATAENEARTATPARPTAATTSATSATERIATVPVPTALGPRPVSSWSSPWAQWATHH